MGFIEALLWNDILCYKCRQSLDSGYRESNKEWLTVHYFYEYRDEIKDAISRFKDLGDTYLAPLFFYPFNLRSFFFFHDYLIVCVPSTKKSLERRGFNHTELLAKTISIESVSNVLNHHGDLLQKEKSKRERMQISDDIVLGNVELLQGRKVLLLDDVCTTGSTLLACANLLKGHCLSVEALCIALVSDF